MTIILNPTSNREAMTGGKCPVRHNLGPLLETRDGLQDRPLRDLGKRRKTQGQCHRCRMYRMYSLDGTRHVELLAFHWS